MSINNTQILLAISLYIISIFANNFTFENSLLTIETGRPKILIYLVALLIVFFSFFLTIKRFKIILPSRIITSILLIGAFFSILNSFVLQDMRPMTNYCVLYFLIFAFINFYAYTDSPIDNIKKIIFGIIFVNFIVVITSFIIETYTIYRYTGIFDNSNSAGRVLGYILVISMAYLIFFKKSHQQKILISILILLTLILLIATNSRTPLAISFLSVFILMYVDRFKKNKNIFRYINVKNSVRFLYLLSPFLIIFYILNYYVDSGTDVFPSLYENFKYQFERNPGSYGTSDRITRWQYALSEYYSFFGSSEYNNIAYSRIEVHNNYLSHALKFGLIPAISFHLLPIIIFFKSLIRIIKYKINEASISLVLSFYLILYYMFETSTLITPFWILLLFEALFLASDNKKN